MTKDDFEQLQSWRQQLNKLDNEIWQLFSQRLEIVQAVGKFKSEQNCPVWVPEREAEIMARLKTACPIEAQEFVANIWQAMLVVSRLQQYDLAKDLTISKVTETASQTETVNQPETTSQEEATNKIVAEPYILTWQLSINSDSYLSSAVFFKFFYLLATLDAEIFSVSKLQNFGVVIWEIKIKTELPEEKWKSRRQMLASETDIKLINITKKSDII